MTPVFNALVDMNVMSTENGPSDDVKKKRRLESGSSSDSDVPKKRDGKAKKKMRKLEAPAEPSNKPRDLRRALAQTHFEVFSNSLATIEARKDPNYVPVYKQKLYFDSPVAEDPYALPDSTPDRKTFPKKIRKQVVSEIGCSSSSDVPSTSLAAPVTPDLPQNTKKRDTPWSPHPGALLKKKNMPRRLDARELASPPTSRRTSPDHILEGTGKSIPDVGFTASPTTRLKSSQSSVNLISKPAELISTPVRMPSRSLLRSSGMSTSALRTRRPIDFDYGESKTEKQPSGLTSPRKKVVVDVEKPASSAGPPSLRRQRSSSVGSLAKSIDNGFAEDAAPIVPKRTRSRSLERKPSEEVRPPPTQSRVLRETPERSRHKSASQERFNMKKSASSNNLALLKNAANVTVGSRITRTFSTGSLAPLASQTTTSKKTTAPPPPPEVITLESWSSSDESPPIANSNPPRPASSPRMAPFTKPPIPMTYPRKNAGGAAPSTPVKKEEPETIVIGYSSEEEYYSVPSSPAREPSHIPAVSRYYSANSDVVDLLSSSPGSSSHFLTDSSIEVLYETQLPPPSQQIVIPPPPVIDLTFSSSNEPPDSMVVSPTPVIQLSSSSSSTDSTSSSESTSSAESSDSTKTEEVICSQDSDVVPNSQEFVETTEKPFDFSLATEESAVQAVADQQDREDTVPCSQEMAHCSIDENSEASSASQEVVHTAPPAPLKGILKTPNSAKNEGRRIDFSNLQVYYFGRLQGFHVVPEHGDIALGMEYQHFHQRELKVLKTRRPKINMYDSDESELSEGEDPGDFCKSNDFEKDNIERQRLLVTNGVTVERQKHAAEMIRRSRKLCGCSCRGGICRPNTCECSRAGVPCQVDRQEADGRFFPCSCSVASLCNNENGHLFYDYERVHDERRNAIQRWKDMHKTGIFASPSVKRFNSEEDSGDDVVADSQEGVYSTPKREDFLLAPRLHGTPVYTNRVERVQIDELPSTPSAPPPRSPPRPPTSFFPPTPSLL